MSALGLPRVSEEAEQASLFRWFGLTRWQGRTLSDYAIHVPNEGKRSGVTGWRLKRVAVGGYHGLWIEMKAVGGRLSEAQREVIAMLRGQGYRVEVCFGWDAARIAVERYLGSVAPVQERG